MRAHCRLQCATREMASDKLGRMNTPYKYPIDQCDVGDEGALERFRRKRHDWLMWLEDDEHHAIWQTLSQMVWREVSFSALSRIADSNPGSALNNPLITEAVLDGHVALQILAVRRLVDDTKGVLSVTKLLADVRANFELFTRENYVCFDGLPYDAEAVAERERLVRTGSGAVWLDTTGPAAYGPSEIAHAQFDRLTGIEASRRTRGDRLPKSILATIQHWIDDSGAPEIAKWSHAYLAHSGSPASRQAIGEYGLKGTKIGKAIAGLARATEGISAYVLFASGRLNSLMATAQFDRFEKFENPIMKAEAADDIAAYWDERSQDFEKVLDTIGQELTFQI